MERRAGNRQLWLLSILAIGSGILCFFYNNLSEYVSSDFPEVRAQKKTNEYRKPDLLRSKSSSLLPQFQVEELCDFYLAESAIPHGGLGVFTARPIKKGESAHPWPDICVYLTDASKKRGTEINTHTWQGFRFGAKWLGAGRGKVRAACMGMVTLFNSMGMQQYASVAPAAVYNLIHTNGGLDRSRDPGAGAITQYYGATSRTLRDLAAGSELMLWDKGNGGSNYEEDLTPEFPGKQYGEDGEVHIVPPVRPPQWLRKHGMCMDNIIVKPATDTSMGRGAFTKRALKRGTVVAPAPLQVFPDRSNFAAPEKDSQNGVVFENPEQLFVNYCFQPPNSTLLLFPYGAGVGLINHASDKSKVNVVLQWSTHPTNHGQQWLDPSLSLEQFFKMQYPGSIIVNVVALRDLQPGEELFMDYGPEWEKAWNDHVQKWKPPSKNSTYVYPWDEMKRHGLLGGNATNNRHHEQQKPFRTLSEQETDPYPDNLMTVCNTANKPKGQKETRTEWAPGIWPYDLHRCTILESHSRRGEDGRQMYYYDVLLKYAKDPSKRYIDSNVSHTAIRFVDKPFESDQHLLNAFRQPIGFPEALTPSIWRNKIE